MINRLRNAAALALLAGAAISCGGDGGGGAAAGACSMIGACGGIVVGDWTVSTSCYEVHGALGGTFCPQGTIAAHATYGGTFTFGADSTYSIAVSVTATEALWYPAACLTSQGAVITCDQLAQATADGTTDPMIASSIQCAASARGGCDCTATAGQPIPPAAGTYTTASATLTTSPNDGSDANNFGYCATANELHLLPPSTTSDGFAASGDIVLVRR